MEDPSVGTYRYVSTNYQRCNASRRGGQHVQNMYHFNHNNAHRPSYRDRRGGYDRGYDGHYEAEQYSSKPEQRGRGGRKKRNNKNGNNRTINQGDDHSRDNKDKDAEQHSETAKAAYTSSTFREFI